MQGQRFPFRSTLRQELQRRKQDHGQEELQRIFAEVCSQIPFPGQDCLEIDSTYTGIEVCPDLLGLKLVYPVDITRLQGFKRLKLLKVVMQDLGRPYLDALAQVEWPDLILLEINSLGANLSKEIGLLTPKWPSIRFLYLIDCGLDSVAAKSIVKSFWTGLEVLNLNDNLLMNEGAKVLASGKWPRLHTLMVENNRIDDSGFQALIRGKWPQLQHLAIGGNRVNYSFNLFDKKRLRTFSYRDVRTKEKGVQQIQTCNWPSLKEVTVELLSQQSGYFLRAGWPGLLRLNQVSRGAKNFGLTALLKPWFRIQNLLFKQHLTLGLTKSISQAYWPRLRELVLTFKLADSDSGARVLSKADWPLLQSLTLCSMGITSRGMAYLSRSSWRQLRSLDLNFNDLRGGLSKLGGFTKLQQLSLIMCKLQDKDLTQLSALRWLRLRSLNLQLNEFGDKGARQLMGPEWAGTRLELDWQSLGQQTCAMLRQR